MTTDAARIDTSKTTLPGFKIGTPQMLVTVIRDTLHPRPESAFDPLTFANETMERYGDFSYSKLGPIAFYNVFSPEIAHQVLVEKADKFVKPHQMKVTLGRFLGNGLLTSDGDFWKRQRKLAQPAFHSKRIEAYAQTMVEYTNALVDTWQAGQTIDMAHDMTLLTLRIVAKTLFDVDVAAQAHSMWETLPVVLEEANNQFNAVFSLPQWLPTPGRIREDRAIAKLNALIDGIIKQRRASATDRGDLLSMFLSATDDEGGGQMTDQQLRDELMTIILAGHETTANAMDWTFYQLAQNPAIEERLHEEVDRVLGDRPATLKDLAQLPYVEMVVKESLRMCPPVPGVIREASEPVEIGGYTIMPGSGQVFIGIYGMHHDPRNFPEPDVFRPERFSPENEKSIPRGAYIPFSSGPRVCIGNSFALMEARLLLATMVQRIQLRLEPNQIVTPEVKITMRPKGGMPLRVEIREHRKNVEQAVVTA